MTRAERLPEMPLFEHLGELRVRLFYSAIAVALCAACAYIISDPVFALLTAPYYRSFNNAALIGTGPAEAFLLKIKVALFAGLIIASPFLFLQLWRFVAPGLYSHERKLVFPFVAAATLLLLVGVSFCYFVILPFAFDFFHAQYQSIGITPTVRLSEHLSTMMTALLGFGVVFEMPVLAYALARVGVINDALLIRSFRHAVVIIFVIAAVVTPPDVLTQFLLAGPLLILYGLSILIVRYAQRSCPEETIAKSSSGEL